MPQNATSDLTRLAQPAPGQTLTIPITEGQMKLGLDFAPDPNFVAKNGQDLEFSFEDGGTIVLQGYYDYFEEGGLPVMVLDSGDEIAGEDFLASLNEDLLTAAGPAAGPGGDPSGGSGEYADDPGALVDGIWRMGSLDTIYWGRATEVPEDYTGLELPGGTFSLGGLTDMGDNILSAAIYEDWQPSQNHHGHQNPLASPNSLPGKLNFNFTPDGSTTVENVALSGFPPGTKIFLGDPSNPAATYDVTSNSATYDFTYAQMVNQGVYVLPPTNADGDIRLNVVLDLFRNGNRGVLDGTGVIVVDAVADLAQVEVTEVITEQDHTKAATPDPSGNTIRTGETTTVDLKIDALFTDVLDTSETHYYQVANVPAEWTLGALPAGWILAKVTADPLTGNKTYLFDLSAKLTADANAAGTGDSAQGKGTITFSPGEWTSTGAHDVVGEGRLNSGKEHASGPAELEVTAIAKENVSDREIDDQNNEAATSITVVIDIVEDTPDIFVKGINNELIKLVLSADEEAGKQAADTAFTEVALGKAVLDAVNTALTGTSTPNQAAPLGVTQDSFDYNLYSDNATNSQSGKPIAALAWEEGTPDIYAKLTGSAATENTGMTGKENVVNDGYAKLQFEFSGPDSAGQHSMTGFFFDASGNKVVALVGILTPDFATDGTATAKVTFVQYTPLQHERELGENMLGEMGFKVTLTDSDGDFKTIDVTYDVKDDIPTIKVDQKASYYEDRGNTVSGNVLTDHASSSGSDGWLLGGNNGVVGYTLELPQGYTVVGNPAGGVMIPGVDHSYSITNSAGKTVGTFSMKSDGSYTFTKNTVDSGLTENITVKVNFTTEDADHDQAKGTLTLDLKAASTLQMYIRGDTVVYEEDAYGKAHSPAQDPRDPDNPLPWDNSGDGKHTIASYHVHFQYPGATAVDPPNTTPTANAKFTFEVALTGTKGVGAGGISYGPKGDLQLGIDVNGDGDITAEDGSFLVKGAESDYLGKLQALLNGMYGSGKVTVSDVVEWDNNGWPTLKFTVQDGTDLSKGLPLTVKAVNDAIGDNGEKFQIALQDPHVETGGEQSHVSVVPDPAGGKGPFVETEILDGGNSSFGSGPWLKLQDVTVRESVTENTGTEQNPVYEQRPADLTLSIKLYEPMKEGGEYGKAEEKGTLWTANRPPADRMQVELTFEGGSADQMKDYLPSADGKARAWVEPTGWTAYDAQGKPIIWHEDAQGPNGKAGWYTSQGGAPVWAGDSIGDLPDTPLPGGAYWLGEATLPQFITDDRFSEQLEDFTVTITGVTGNEATYWREDGPSLGKGQNGSGSTVKIEDDDLSHGKTELSDGTPVVPTGDDGYKDGPQLESFALVGKLREPGRAAGQNGGAKDGNVPITDPDDINGNSAPVSDKYSTGTYAIVFDGVAAEDIIVSLDLTAASSGLNKDFTPGEGLYTYEQLKTLYPGGLPAYFKGQESDGGYYVIVKAGFDKANFEVNITHDHDAAKVSGGMDSNAGGQNTDGAVQWQIGGMWGSEVQWGAGAKYGDHNKPQTALDPIHDDMRGPFVKLVDYNEETNPNPFIVEESGGTYTVKGMVQLSTQVSMGENATVFFEAVGADGKTYAVTGKAVIGPDGKAAGFELTLPPALAAQEYFHLRVQSTDRGGETRWDDGLSSPIFVDHGTGGTSKPPLHVRVESSDIYEVLSDTSNEGPASATYTVSVGNLENYEGGDVSFSITPVHNSSENEDFKPEGATPPDSVTITFTEKLLEDLQAKGDDFTAVLRPGVNGKPDTLVITDAEGDETTYQIVDGKITHNGQDFGEVTGNLPTAFDDKHVEGTESFTPIVTNPSGAIPEPGKKPEPADIIDNDEVTITVEFGYADGNAFTRIDEVTEGEMKHKDGDTVTDYVVRVSLLENGQPFTLPEGAEPVTFTIKVTSVSGDVNNGTTDVSVHSQTVTIYPGESLSDVRVTFPDDFISDDGKRFTVELENTDGTPITSIGDLAGATVTYEGSLADTDPTTGGVLIHDKVNGPTASLAFDDGFGGTAKTVSEGQSANYLVRLDKAVEEESSATVRLTFANGDTKDGMTLSDVESIVIDGKTYLLESLQGKPDGSHTLASTDGLAQITVKLNVGSGDTTLDVEIPLHTGSSGGRFTINTFDDYVKEGKETLDVSLTGVSKGELEYEAGTVTLTVNDHPSGPGVTLTAPDTATEGEASVFTLHLDKPTGAASTVTLTLDANWESVLHKDGNNQYWAEFEGQKYEIVNGAITIPLTSGMASGGYDLKFTLKDNASTADPNNPLPSLGVAVTGVEGGEASVGGLENPITSVLSGQDGNSCSFLCESLKPDGTADSLKSAATVKYVLNGLTQEGAENTVVTVDGKTGYTIKGSPGSYYIEVEHKAGDTMDDVIRLSAKNNYDSTKYRDVTVAAEVSLRADVDIRDDANDPLKADGPVFTVAADNSSGVTEGDPVTFTVSAAPKADFTTTEQDITVSFKLTGDSDNIGTVSVNGQEVTAGTDGIYSFTVSAPADLNASNQWTVSVATKTDGKLNVDNAIGIEITGVSGGEARLGAQISDETPLIETSSAMLLFERNAAANVAEGADAGFTLKLVDATDTGKAMTASEAITVTFKISGGPGFSAADDLVWTPPPSGLSMSEQLGVYTVTATLGAGESELSVSIPTARDGVIEGDEALYFTFVGAEANGQPVSFYDNTNSADMLFNETETFDYRILDGDLDGLNQALNAQYTATELEGMEVISINDAIFSAASLDHRVGVLGGSGNNDITGSRYDDIIVGGAGGDTLTGGLGDDTFQWKAGDEGTTAQPAVDVVTDFAMDVNNSGGEDDMLDLSGLIDLQSGETLDDYLSIREENGNAVLEIAGVPQGETVQTIVLENVYTTYENNTQNISVEDLIIQHVLYNS